MRLPDDDIDMLFVAPIVNIYDVDVLFSGKNCDPALLGLVTLTVLVLYN